ncbi:RNA polymerase sigma factor SigK [Cellulomonas aerilata]|uniref:RNA polymerase sigma factor SigK n=1 Tax=Cellulomonas aerilata TaxID=515326 RepID=A0A512D7P5_9CELL|nr:RNA polymerase sigma factor SigK [Cellulomonas aerilata]
MSLTCAAPAPARGTAARAAYGRLSRVTTSPGGVPLVPEAEEPVGADALLARVAAGDEDAFARLYDLLASGVFGTCLAVLRDRDHAAEVTQEVMVEVWRTATRFDAGRGSARTWALTLAHRRAVDRVRAVQSQRTRDQRVLDEQGERPFDVVAEEVEDSMDRERVRHCLEGLTPTQHEAVVLAYYGGRTYREVAEQLAAPLTTVKTRIRDGLLRLRDCLGVVAA